MSEQHQGESEKASRIVEVTSLQTGSIEQGEIRKLIAGMKDIKKVKGTEERRDAVTRFLEAWKESIEERAELSDENSTQVEGDTIDNDPMDADSTEESVEDDTDENGQTDDNDTTDADYAEESAEDDTDENGQTDSNLSDEKPDPIARFYEETFGQEESETQTAPTTTIEFPTSFKEEFELLKVEGSYEDFLYETLMQAVSGAFTFLKVMSRPVELVRDPSEQLVAWLERYHLDSENLTWAVSGAFFSQLEVNESEVSIESLTNEDVLNLGLSIVVYMFSDLLRNGLSVSDIAEMAGYEQEEISLGTTTIDADADLSEVLESISEGEITSDSWYFDFLYKCLIVVVYEQYKSLTRANFSVPSESSEIVISERGKRHLEDVYDGLVEWLFEKGKISEEKRDALISHPIEDYHEEE